MSMWQRREDLSLSHSLLLPFDSFRLHLSPPTTTTHTATRVTTHRSRSEVSSSSFTFTTLPPCTPSTRCALLFYYSTRPRRVRLLPRRIYRETSLFPLSLSFILPSHLLPSPPFSHLLQDAASRVTEKLESRHRIRGSAGAVAAACVRWMLLTSSYLRHFHLLKARLQLVCLGFGSSRGSFSSYRFIIPLAVAAPSTHVSVAPRSRILKSCMESRQK